MFSAWEGFFSEVTSLSYLSAEFLAKYNGLRPRHAGLLFDVVYLRTYSRWLEDKKRRETWNETVERVVNYNMDLYDGPIAKEDRVEEAERLYDSIFHLEVLPAGRTLWVGGTGSAIKHGESQFNCSGVVIDELEAFTDLFQLLLCGCGVGFRVLKEDVDKLPTMGIDIQVKNRPYEPAVKGLEHTFHRRLDNHWEIYVGDSREGWVTALRLFLEACQETGSRIEIEYNAVRPAGRRIKSFGGLAPGPSGLMDMFLNLAKIINNANGKLSPLDCVDICNFIGKNVIVGGTRRSSQISLGSPDDIAFMEAKKNLWVDKTNLQRTMSNNSVAFTLKPSKEQIHSIFDGIRHNGEPGFFNLAAARKRHLRAAVVNPCGEAILANRSYCNLSTLNLRAFAVDGKFLLSQATEAIKLATRIGCRATNVTVSLPKWDFVQKRDRLLGVSMTGIMDAFDALGWEHDSPEAISILSRLRQEANQEADRYAYEMRIPRPLLVTILKPEGTLSQLPTVSSGLHRSYAPYFIRRIRVSSMDPTCRALQTLGVPNEPDQGKAERIVFSFPIASGAKCSAADEPALRQFDRYLTMMEHYVDHNASCTLTVGEEEWEDIEKAVYDNFDKVVAVSFLGKDCTAYPQMPYEAITKEQYDEMAKSFPDLSTLAELINKYENEEYEGELLEDACAQGVCPLR